MSNQIYPGKVRGLTWTVDRKMAGSNYTQKSRSGAETRILNWNNPMWTWYFIYDYLHDDPNNVVPSLTSTDLRTLMGFIASRFNSFDDFLLDDPTDDTVGPGTLTTAWAANQSVYIGYSVLSAGHWQKVTAVTTGVTGATIPTFSTSGGTVVDGGVSWTDQGGGYSAIPNLSAQLQIVTDTTDPITAAVVGSSAGSGFVVGDYLAVTGGGGAGGILKVNTVSGGAITSFIIVDSGVGYATTTGAALTVLSGVGTGSPTANITAGTVYYSPIQRLLGGPGGFFEDVTDLNGSIAVYDNGVLKTLGTDYTVGGPGLAIPGNSFYGMYLTWINTPTGPVTATFNFYFRVKFMQADQDFEAFASLLSTIGGSESKNGRATLDLITSRVKQL